LVERNIGQKAHAWLQAQWPVISTTGADGGTSKRTPKLVGIKLHENWYPIPDVS
jgi:hypothetical protein